MSEREFLLPDVGEGLTEADVVTWKVAVGDTVSLNQPLVDIETAKAVVELPSPFAGTVVRLVAGEGDTLEVGQPLLVIDVLGGESVTHTPEASAPRQAVLVGYGVADESATPTRRHHRASAPVAPPPLTTAPVSGSPVPRSTPPVRLYAKQQGVSLATLVGTGRHGLITHDDVDRARGGTVTKTQPAVAHEERFAGVVLAPWVSGPREERVVIKGVAKSMAESMTTSALGTPHAGAWVSVDATATVEMVAGLKARLAGSDVRVTPLTVIALAVVDGLKTFPGMNSAWDGATNDVLVRRYVNLGIASNTPRGLLVPNLKDADRMSVVDVATALTELVDTARAGTTTLAAMSGTTFTITNVGPFGIDGALPILPLGTAGILAVGQIRKAPWVVHDQVVVRDVVELTLSFDHRMIDGALASRFLRHVANVLENPAPALLVP